MGKSPYRIDIYVGPTIFSYTTLLDNKTYCFYQPFVEHQIRWSWSHKGVLMQSDAKIIVGNESQTCWMPLTEHVKICEEQFNSGM